MPLAQRETVTLRLEGLSHREIAQVLGISENYVVARLTRARAELVRHRRSAMIAATDWTTLMNAWLYPAAVRADDPRVLVLALERVRHRELWSLIEATPRMLAMLAAFTLCLAAWSTLAVRGNARERRDLERLQAEFAGL